MTDPLSHAIARHMVDLFRAMVLTAEADRYGGLRYVTREQHPLANAALVGPGASPKGVAELVGPLADGAFPSAVILTGGDDEVTAALLVGLGYVRAESMGLMSVTADTLRATEVPEGYRFVELGLQDQDRFCQSFAAGYGVPLTVAGMFSPAAAARAALRMRFYGMQQVGDTGGMLAAVSACVVLNGLAGIYMVATRPEHRGKGLGAHLAAEPLRMAWAEGIQTGILQSSAMGDPVYRRIGYRSHGSIPLFVRVPSADRGKE